MQQMLEDVVMNGGQSIGEGVRNTATISRRSSFLGDQIVTFSAPPSSIRFWPMMNRAC